MMMSKKDSLRLCIVGHSGIGKSPLTKLFDLTAWEPFRIRVPRNAEDAKVCKSPDEYERLERQHSGTQPIYASPQGSSNRLRVYEHWSFFEVRRERQCLDHKEAKNESASLRIEIFAPVFLEMLKNLGSLGSAFTLTVENLLILLLNPTSKSFRDMPEPSQELRLATLFAVTERDRLMGKSVDLADSLRRVEYLTEELIAWREMSALFPKNTVECQKWPHFEFLYTSPAQGQWHGRVELAKAKTTVLDAVEKQAPEFAPRLLEIMCSEDELQ
jgi:hypothetical protein